METNDTDKLISNNPNQLTTIDLDSDSNSTNLEERICRICFEEEDDPENNTLINPCRCKGSSKWVHTQCLNDWRATSINPEAFTTCLICKYTYRTQQVVNIKTHFKQFNLFLARHSIIFFLINLIGITLLSLVLIKFDTHHKILSLFLGKNKEKVIMLSEEDSWDGFINYFLNSYEFMYYFIFSMIIYTFFIVTIFLFNFLFLRNKRLYLNHYKINSWCYILSYIVLLFLSIFFSYLITAFILTIGIQIIINRHYQIIENLDRASDSIILPYTEE